MTDQHAHAGYAGYDGHSTADATGALNTDPLFGALPGGYDTDHTGAYDTGQWNAYGAQQYRHQQTSYDTTGQWTIPAQSAGPDVTGQWDASAWNQAQQTGQFETTAFAYDAAYDTTGQWTVPGAGYAAGSYDETGTYNTAAWNVGVEAYEQQRYEPAYENEHVEARAESTAQFPALDIDAADGFDASDSSDSSDSGEIPQPEAGFEPGTAPEVVAVPLPRRPAGGSRSRRRSPAKRSALLTVAVPSVCVMGVAGVAAASVSGLGGEGKDDGTAVTASDPSSVKPVAANSKLDTQLANLSAEAGNFADRASRTQERLDLKARQDAAKQAKAEAAARKEAARPKFLLPVKQRGLSAYFGQAGVNWMSVHTGIDFPVSYGTPVMSAIDGTIRTQWNSAYGNMAIVTAADGTETWYCHLSSTKLRSGPVKAGDVIAYSGNSGNSTGPHLHFEVRPGGGSPIDPLPWLRSHGLDPT
ncbi:M23 family metallopeptidase [Streptomyces sp. BPTC-684]|uniref:M23 family metallopeptidase n=1 Tax=Streptomyces sp. BPTC-684 TaxID=3043734 RepID=UPI0024B245E3|nr:M23 family metallopeptidase [Streptomyces sp. BPTC-684]WHM37080.1 M23 family metallopeptidase [Streptomyces sp. BPTC-684]